MIFLATIVAFLSFEGCKGNDMKNNSDQTARKKVENYANFDDELDVKSEAIVDTQLLRKELNNILPPETILELFGSGYQNFYMGLTISKDNTHYFVLGTDATYWVAPGNQLQDMTFNDGTESDMQKKYRHMASHTNSKETGKNSIFSTRFTDNENIFKVKAGQLNGKAVRSIKLFEINTFIGPDGKAKAPWSVNEVPINKYKEHLLEKNTNTYYYMTGLPAVSIDGFESVKKAIEYPQEALKKGVSGRVIVQIFADINGNYAGYQLLKGLGYGCDEAVINALQNSKFHTYPMGQRSSIIVPFEFGPSKATPIDLAVQTFDNNPDPNVYNNLRLGIVNKNKLEKNINRNYFIYVYIDNHLVFQNYCTGISTMDTQQFFWFRWRPNKPGTYNYVIYIDPEKRLNDSNLENNTLRGTLAFK
jgi:TonB family protein